MSWWDQLHSEENQEKPASTLGLPIPLDCARALDGEPVLIKNGFDGFHATKLHEILKQQGIDTLVIIGLITRFPSKLSIITAILVKISLQSVRPQYLDVCFQPRVTETFLWVTTRVMLVILTGIESCSSKTPALIGILW